MADKKAESYRVTFTIDAAHAAMVRTFVEAAMLAEVTGFEDLAEMVDEDGEVDIIAAVEWANRGSLRCITKPLAEVRGILKNKVAALKADAKDFARLFPEAPESEKRVKASKPSKVLPVESKPATAPAPVKRTGKAKPVTLKLDATKAPTPDPKGDALVAAVTAPQAKGPKSLADVQAGAKVKAARMAPKVKVTAPKAPSAAREVALPPDLAAIVATLTPAQVEGLKSKGLL